MMPHGCEPAAPGADGEPQAGFHDGAHPPDAATLLGAVTGAAGDALVAGVHWSYGRVRFATNNQIRQYLFVRRRIDLLGVGTKDAVALSPRMCNPPTIA